MYLKPSRADRRAASISSRKDLGAYLATKAEAVERAGAPPNPGGGPRRERTATLPPEGFNLLIFDLQILTIALLMCDWWLPTQEEFETILDASETCAGPRFRLVSRWSP